MPTTNWVTSTTTTAGWSSLTWNGNYLTGGTLITVPTWSITPLPAPPAPTWTTATNSSNFYCYSQGLNPGYDAPDYDAVIDYDRAAVANAAVSNHLDLGHDFAAEHEARRVARVTAEDRATGLLLSVLTGEQQAAYKRDGSFEVIGSCGGRYRINKGSAGNVEWFDPDTGRVAAKLCAHPSMRDGWLPDQDVAVAQMLALMTDEVEFVRIANVHAGRRPTMLRRLRAVA